MIPYKLKTPQLLRPLTSQKGYMLVAALTLMTVLTLLGTTAYILSSTDIKVGGNFRNSQQTLQVAMAGGERARELLRLENRSSSNYASFTDELSVLLRRGVNLVLDGNTTPTDDQPIASGTMNGIFYAAYLTNDSSDGTANTTDANGKVMITTVATGTDNSKAIVQTVVRLFPGPSSPSTVYTKGDVTGNGTSLTISGNDACNQGPNLDAIYAKGDWNPNGSPTITGAVTEYGTLELDIAGMISQLKASANVTLTEDTNGATYGSSSDYKVVYSNTSSPANVNGLKLNNITGYGILLVEGDLELAGGFNWNGIILVTGAVKLNGGGNDPVNIAGQLLSGTSTVTDISVNGANNITYNSCKVKDATTAAPLTVVNWKQSF
jgi:Tfp pilus assembly protein PilX